jgi:hypothetical protein
MDQTGATIYPSLQPSNPRRCVTADGYEACFYPGFVRRLALVSPDGRETVMYEQKTPFILPAGQLKAWPTSVFELRGNGRTMQLQLHDPEQQVDRIEIVLKPRPDIGRGAERLIMDDGPVFCPPICPDPTRTG